VLLFIVILSKLMKERRQNRSTTFAARKQSSKGEISPSSAHGQPPVGFPLAALHQCCHYELRFSEITPRLALRPYGSVRCSGRTVRRAVGYQILEVNNL
jgi:hypothetical protein